MMSRLVSVTLSPSYIHTYTVRTGHEVRSPYTKPVGDNLFFTLIEIILRIAPSWGIYFTKNVTIQTLKGQFILK
jgi:hypothetical protein